MSIRIDGTNTAANPGITGADTDTGLQFGTDEVKVVTGGSDRVTVDSSGRVGLDATPTAQFTGHSILQIGAQSSLGANQTLSTTGQTYLSHNLYFDTDGNFQVFNTGSANEGSMIQLVDGSFRFRTSAATTGTPSVEEQVRIDSEGRLGLGTTSPSRDFHNANGTCLTTGAAPQYRLNGGAGDSNDDDRAIFGLATGNNHFFSGTSAGDTVLRTTSGGNLLFGTGTEERFRIASNGRVTAQVIYGTPISGTTRDVFIQSNGQLGYISSIRDSKVNINLLSNVDWIYQLQPSTFNYKLTDQEGAYTGEVNPELEYGLIAEDVEPVAPELCFYDEVDGEQELRGVHYKKLIVPMLKALQEANAKIESLETQNTAQQAQIDDLLARVTTLEATE